VPSLAQVAVQKACSRSRACRSTLPAGRAVVGWGGWQRQQLRDMQAVGVSHIYQLGLPRLPPSRPANPRTIVRHAKV
jgi:hypothetical protein